MAHLSSAQYFPALGINLEIGRGFSPGEDVTPGGSAVAVISDSLWKRLYNADPAIASKTIELNGRTYQIIGVAPPGFQGVTELYGADVWLPFMMYPQVLPSVAYVQNRRALVFSIAGRLKPGVTMPQAEGEMKSLASDLERQYPRENLGRGVRLAPVSEATLSKKDRSTYTETGQILLIVSGLVLLIACANVANLLLARSAARTREIAVRLALGAKRSQLVRQLLTESCLLALAGSIAGLAAASWLRSLLWAARPPAFKYARFDFGLDYRMLGYTLGVALLTGILFGLWPALRATKPNLASDLKERTGAPQSAVGRWSLRSLLVVAQVALCLVALIGAGLFLRSLRNADAIDPGFDVTHLATVSYNAANRGYDEAHGREFQRQALAEAASTPGVEMAALAKDPPLIVSGQRTVLLQGQDAGIAGPGRATLTGIVGPGFFQTARMPLLRGRDFTVADQKTTPKIAVINDVAAARFWPGQDPLGKVFQFAGENLPVQIIGVVRVADYQAIGEPHQGMIYLCLDQYYSASGVIYFRGAGDLDATMAAVRRRVQSLDPNLLLQSETVRFTLRQTLWAQSLSAGLLTLFGVLAALLAAIGLYGVISYSINLRTREFGLRSALGADALQPAAPRSHTRHPPGRGRRDAWPRDFPLGRSPGKANAAGDEPARCVYVYPRAQHYDADRNPRLLVPGAPRHAHRSRRCATRRMIRRLRRIDIFFFGFDILRRRSFRLCGKFVIRDRSIHDLGGFLHLRLPNRQRNLGGGRHARPIHRELSARWDHRFDSSLAHQLAVKDRFLHGRALGDFDHRIGRILRLIGGHMHAAVRADLARLCLGRRLDQLSLRELLVVDAAGKRR